MNKQELMSLLQEYCIPLDQWGIGNARTFDDLWSEVSSGEVTLLQREGKLHRSMDVSTVRVHYLGSAFAKTCFRLVEEKQVFKDGRERRRQLEGSVSEKIRPNEDPVVAAYRALEEELGITERVPLTMNSGIPKGPVPSVSFPGLMDKLFIHVFSTELLGHLYKPEGYVEHDEDTDNYYIWVPY